MQDGVSAIPGAGYSDTNFTWYQVPTQNLPLAADVTTANIPDNQVYPELAFFSSSLSSSSSLSYEIIKKAHFMVADPGYDDHDLYGSSLKMGFQLVCPVPRYRKTPEERLRLIDFYESALGQVVYSRRGVSIEPLIEHIKSYSG